MGEVGEVAREVGLVGRGGVADGLAVGVVLRRGQLRDVDGRDGQVEVGASLGEQVVVEEAEGQLDARAQRDVQLQVDVRDVGLEGDGFEGVVLAVGRRGSVLGGRRWVERRGGLTVRSRWTTPGR